MWDAVTRVLTFPFKLLCYLLIYIYKWIISPFLPKKCAYFPTCSTFMLESIKEFGIIKGLALGIKRLARCTPSADGGIDFVPYSLKGESRWIY